MLLSYLYTSPPVNERLAIGIPVLSPETRRLEICEKLQRLEKVIGEAQVQVKTGDGKSGELFSSVTCRNN